MRNELYEHDLDYIPREQLRAAKVLNKAISTEWLQAFGDWAMRSRVHQLLGPLRRDATRVAISEENLLGSARNLLSWPFYPQAEQRLQVVRPLGSQAKLHVFISIRGFDDLLPSAYAEVLRFRPVPGGFGPIRELALSRPPSWIDLIERVKTVLPQSKLTVWTFEDYRRNPSAVISAFCGMPINVSRNVSIPAETKTPSARAIDEIERLSPRIRKAEHKARADEIIRACMSAEKYDPFSKEERDFLKAAYRDELRQLQAKFPGVLMTTG